MKGISSLASAVHHLNIIDDYFTSFQNDNPGTKGATLFNGYQKKVRYIIKDLITHPFLPDHVREGMRKQSQSDPFTFMAIAEKAALLSPDQRDLVETMIDGFLKGENIQFIKDEESRNMATDTGRDESIKKGAPQLA